MPVNEIYGSGRIPKKGDTKRMLTVKRLTGLIVNKGTSNPNNVAHKGDTLRVLRRKIDNVLAGV